MRHSNRLKTNTAILAVDFDGTLCTHMFPDIGAPNIDLIEISKKLQKRGNKLILWTCREGSHLREAIDWCAGHGLIFDGINQSLDSEFSHLGEGRKAYFHLTIDDKCMRPEEFVQFYRDLYE